MPIASSIRSQSDKTFSPTEATVLAIPTPALMMLLISEKDLFVELALL